MATNDKSPTPPIKGPSLSDTNARDSFIAAALSKVVSWQMAEGKINHDQAGALAVRYANAAMAWRSKETAPLDVVVAKGAHVAPVETPVPPPPATTTEDLEKPKTIAEIIGEAEPVAELK